MNHKNIPQHVAIIMDGNRRWAKKHLLNLVDGHKKGSENIKNICKECIDIGVKKLTIYAFSTENWSRESDEIKYLTKLMMDYLSSSDVDEMLQSGVVFKVIGDPKSFGNDLYKKIINLENKSVMQNGGEKSIQLNIALSYGAKDEITRSVNYFLLHNSNITSITIDDITNNLDESSPVDLLIRTGGDFRMSNFLLWQAAYAELFFTKTLWPEFTKTDLLVAIDFFQQQKRNFGC